MESGTVYQEEKSRGRTTLTMSSSEGESFKHSDWQAIMCDLALLGPFILRVMLANPGGRASISTTISELHLVLFHDLAWL